MKARKIAGWQRIQLTLKRVGSAYRPRAVRCEAGCIAGRFVERLQTLPDVTQLGLDVSDAGFKRIEFGCRDGAQIAEDGPW